MLQGRRGEMVAGSVYLVFVTSLIEHAYPGGDTKVNLWKLFLPEPNFHQSDNGRVYMLLVIAGSWITFMYIYCILVIIILYIMLQGVS